MPSTTLPLKPALRKCENRDKSQNGRFFYECNSDDESDKGCWEFCQRESYQIHLRVYPVFYDDTDDEGPTSVSTPAEEPVSISVLELSTSFKLNEEPISVRYEDPSIFVFEEQCISINEIHFGSLDHGFYVPVFRDAKSASSITGGLGSSKMSCSFNVLPDVSYTSCSFFTDKESEFTDSFRFFSPFS